MKIILKMDSTDQIIARRGLNPHGRVQKIIDNNCMKFVSKYLPMQTGELRNAMIGSTAAGSGEISIDSPKARFLNEGKLMVGEQSRSAWAKPNERKIVVQPEIPLNYDKKQNALAGPHFFERMKADYGIKILNAAAEEVGAKGVIK